MIIDHNGKQYLELPFEPGEAVYIGATVDSATAELIRRLGRDCPVPKGHPDDYDSIGNSDDAVRLYLLAQGAALAG